MIHNSSSKALRVSCGVLPGVRDETPAGGVTTPAGQTAQFRRCRDRPDACHERPRRLFQGFLSLPVREFLARAFYAKLATPVYLDDRLLAWILRRR